jgi:hypothetical protein
MLSSGGECRMQQEKRILPVGATVQDPAGDRYLVRDRRCAQNLFALKEIIDPNRHDRARFTFEGAVLKRLITKPCPVSTGCSHKTNTSACIC